MTINNQVRPVLTARIQLLVDTARPGHYLAGWFVPGGSILELHIAHRPELACPYGDQYGPEWVPIRCQYRFEHLSNGTVDIHTKWHLLVVTGDKEEEVEVVVPGSAILRWPTRTKIVRLLPAEYERLRSIRAQVDRSYEAIGRAYDEPSNQV